MKRKAARYCSNLYILSFCLNFLMKSSKFMHFFLTNYRNFAAEILQGYTKTKYSFKKVKSMKRIEAIIRKTKFEEVKEALLHSDIDWFEYHDVHGIGQSRQERIYRGVQYSTDVIERVAITIVCRDIIMQPTVNVILRVAHTGQVGDGRIFVSDVIDTWSIRTGEHGDTVLRDKK